ncbi:MAG: M48 family metalloprotease, partial [Planctomycetota bacterium]
MLNFRSRRLHAVRRSAQLLFLISVTEIAASLLTGAVVGYLFIVPSVLIEYDEKLKWEAAYSKPAHLQGFSTDVQGHRSLVPHAPVQASSYPAPKRSFESFRNRHRRRGVEEPAHLAYSRLPRLTVFLVTAGVASGIMLIGLGVATALKRRSLREKGGRLLALEMGAREIADNSRGEERQLVNIVEELSIANHMLPPALFALDGESGINAFAAGFTEEDQSVVVTAGALRHLSRDEMQAVIAHEFFHLIEGDTRIGTELTAAIYGMDGICRIAETMIRDGAETLHDDKRHHGGGLAWIIFGVALWPCGLICTIAARLLSNAICRHRELAADAHAVATTRHPDALATALRKVAGCPKAGRLTTPNRSLVAPMLFVAGDRFCQRLMATHPPLWKRVRAASRGGELTPIVVDLCDGRPTLGSAAPRTAEVLKRVFSGQEELNVQADPAAATILA